VGRVEMIKLNLVSVGNLKEKYWVDAVAEYAKRISRFADIRITEVSEGKTVAAEGEAVLKKLKGYKIITDIGGKLVSSPDIADIMENTLNNGKSEISVVIGGSEGLSDAVKNAADTRISFGRVTYPHQLMRVIVCEQLYRALTIMNHVTYHK
jgi:23S rRNA (pseudouridine1915-N3)-methyltransferase